MSTELQQIDVGGLAVEVHRKSIRNLHVGVYPPEGRVRVAAPAHMDDEAIRLAVVSRLAWIRRQQRMFQAQPRESGREMVTGESHYFRGQRYRLNVTEQRGATGVRLVGNHTMELTAPPGSDLEARQRLLQRWYREQLRQRTHELLPGWQSVVGEEVAECRIKQMKTKWGSCNIEARRIWLNLDLIRKPESCLEYILVHELVHLLERQHNDRFRTLMDSFLPDWRLRRDQLNQSPLAHQGWDY